MEPETDHRPSQDNPDSASSLQKSVEDIYCFESDHLALKGNPDYQALLRTIAVLEGQRIQAFKDLDDLHECQKDALKDPIAFVENLQNGVDFKFPKPLNIASIPEIAWEKYTKNVDFSSFGIHRHMTRLKRQLVEGTSDEDITGMKAKLSAGLPGCSTVPDDPDGITVVRGRVKTERKPASFNQLWSVEEQKRLEELLTIFPPEEVEAKRWQKIANALGNRTPQQVASRVQKYFIKLAKAGLPVPGRIPNLTPYSKKSGHRHQRYNRMYYQSSTFLQSYEPPVYMSDDEDSKSYTDSYTDHEMTTNMQADSRSTDVSDDEQVPVDLRNTPEYQELLRLKRIKQDRLQTQGGLVEHFGFRCDNCDSDPIVGTRWHCLDCPQDDAVDLCDDCADSTFETSTHNSSHRFKPVKKGANPGLLDQDYMRFMPGDYNYLDPNYMPAS